ncbi:hypothetical protein, partial [Clavibacter michiganensis]|uniref:hypothetical protein n=1 Tax=Clavibacter michiganensis TaxID=28447 RepID=UPI00292EF2A5
MAMLVSAAPGRKGRPIPAPVEPTVARSCLRKDKAVNSMRMTGPSEMKQPIEIEAGERRAGVTEQTENVRKTTR